MKLLRVIGLVVFVVAFTAVVAMASDYVNVGNPAAEVGYNLVSWGPVEPATSGGSWGGIADWPGSCRVIWSPADQSPGGAGSISAEVDMFFSGSAEIVSFQHLDGFADESFTVFVEGVPLWSYSDTGTTEETWYVNGFTHNPGPAGLYTVAFVATGPMGPDWDSVGQVAIAGIWISGGPVATENSSWGSMKSLFR